MPRKPLSSEGKRIRGSAGQTARLRRLKRTNGLCEMCLELGTTRLATVVDHIKPLAQGGADIDSNTRNLCDDHHAEVTAEQFGRAAPVTGRGIGRNGRPTSPDHPWNAARA